MPLYHITMTQGRSDTFTVESSSYNKIKQMLNSLSTANIDNIKEIVYSKDLDINYSIKTTEANLSNSQMNVLCKSKKYTKLFHFPLVAKNLSVDKVSNIFKKHFLINGEPVIEILNITINEGLPEFGGN